MSLLPIKFTHNIVGIIQFYSREHIVILSTEKNSQNFQSVPEQIFCEV